MMRKSKLFLLIIIFVVISGAIIFLVPKKPPSKEKMIEDFNRNYEVFQSVADFALETDGDFSANGNLFKVSIGFYDTADEAPGMNDEVKKSITKLLGSLRYSSISESDDVITFSILVGTLEHGILYVEGDNVPDYLYDVEKIADHWYYYWFGYV